jgi:hypothetical protein
MLGNIFFSYQEIDDNGELFKSWVELTSPVWEAFGTDITDVISLKRWLAFLEGGLLPIISLTSLHFFIKYDDNKSNKIEYTTNEDVTITPEKIEYPLSGTDATYIIVEEDSVEDVVQDNVQDDILPENIETDLLEEVVESTIEEEVVESTIEEEVVESTIEEEVVESTIEEEVVESTIEEEIKKSTDEEEEQLKYETSQYFDMQDQLTPVTTTTTDDGIRRLTYTKPS